jgi:hypothetical protein
MSSLCRVYANKIKQSSVKHNKEPRMDLWNFKDKTFVAVDIRDSSVVDSVTIFIWKKRTRIYINC